MKEVVFSPIIWVIAGFLFDLLRVSIPAPPVSAGVTEVDCVYLGFKTNKWDSCNGVDL
ncbi:XapX domain-containing protein [Bacillus sp. HMF5848]|uniref:XapX domain-containing protein n=1 Tax=Bacillus sp. HMF5848 TaxID=2495421 RepID=UPI000F7A92BF|nr:DUF1427 family protein [Bacillus sp. HMF5848]RSK28985.1 XapX domain-containing protein [Bacillus sp. HMF5848]